MNRKSLAFVTLMSLIGVSRAYATTDWSTQDYDLYSGDFNGDGKTDILYVAKDVSKASGIAVADGSGGPNTPFQSWPSNYLGIPWAGNVYRAVVADFNGDGKADILLQRSTPGDHYLLFADAQGKITGISQTISNGYLGSADKYRVLAGDISGDGRADLFLQAMSAADASAVIFANGSGQFTLAATQTLNDGSLGFNWSASKANVFLGDFNGDGKHDVLVQAKPKIVMVDYDIPIPVPTYPPNLNGVAFSQGGATPFQLAYIQQWSRTGNGVDWSPNTANIVVGDFDGNGRADVVLQARNSASASYLLSGNSTGAAFGSPSTLASNVTWSAASYRLIAGNFDGTGSTGVYFQSTSAAGTNVYANVITGGSISTTTHDPAGATGVVPASAVGHTVGSFAVSNTGAATYSIPIVVPPGIAGVQPALSINYQSGSGNGLLGVGWGLGGFSEIERCAKTVEQDGAPDAVALTAADRFCLDGNKLRLTSGTYGAAGSTYQTELETFARVTASGSAGNGPAYFSVETKDGLIYEYGNTTDSRIEAVNAPVYSTTPHTWALNKVSDRHGNTMTIAYQEDGAPNGSFRPSQILYTSNATASVTSAYRVDLIWETRPSTDTLTGYVAGGLVKETKRLNRIETKYNDPVGGWRLVRKYQLSYNTSGSTPRTRLGAIQECDRNGDCLAPTMISWQDGGKGWESTDTTSTTNSAAMLEYSYPIDINGDGRDDLVYPETVSGITRWHYMLANSTGGFGTPVNTGIDAGNATNQQYAMAQPIDYFSEGRLGLLVDIPGYGTRQILRWNGSTLALSSTNLTIALSGKEWVADFDGDGRADVLYSTYASGTGYFYVQKNSGATSGTAQFAAAVQFYSTAVNGTVNPFTGNFASWLSRVLDFNGDGRADFIYSQTTFACPMGPPLCVYNTTWNALTSTGSSFVSSLVWTCTSLVSACEIPPLVGDFNGDGLTDVISHAGDLGGTSNWKISYGSGTGLSTAINITLPSDFRSLSGPAQPTNFVEDYDHDGLADLLYAPSATGGSWYVLRSTGTAFEAPVSISLSSSSANNTIRALDFDGDGLRDLGFKSTQFRARKHKGTLPDFVRSITDGFGNQVSVTYAPLTDSSVYTKGTGAQFPAIDIQTPMYVVKSYSASDGLGGTYAVTQKYAGLRVHTQGRGLLGFASRESVDSRNGIKSTWTYLQNYPYIGMVQEASTYQSAGGSLIARATNTPATLTLSSAQYNERKFPYIQTSLQKSYEVGGAGNGQAIAEVTTSTTLDSFGNPTNVTTTTVDKTGSNLSYMSSTDTVYATADSSCWWRGLVTSQTVTNTVPSYAAQTRTVQYVKDTSAPLACRVYQEIVEPSDNAVKVTTTYGYDAFGHPNSQVVSAANIQSRTTSTSYGSQGVFPVSVTQSVTSTFNQAASKIYDYALGVPKSATDPNGLVVNWEYDGFGRLVQESRPDNTKTTWTYSACTVGNGYCGDARLRYQVEKRELNTGNGVIRSTKQLFDAFGRSLYDQSQTLSGAYSNVATNYDNQGRMRQRSQPYFTGFPAFFTTVSYDLIGRPTQEERPISEAVSTPQTTKYGYNRLVHTQEDANGKTTTKHFNAIGQVVQMTDAASGITKYDYDPFGNLRKTTDPANNEIVNTFNIRGFKLTSNDPDMGQWTYTYYPTGELWTQTDAKSQTVTFTYDHLSRPKTRVEPEGTTTFTYGESQSNKNVGKLQSVSAPGGYAESFAYDSLGRLQDATTTADATSFVVSNSYNAITGFLETVTYPTSTSAVAGSRFKVQYEYAAGLLKRVKDYNTPTTVYWEQIATNAAGQTIDETYGNGLHTYSTYDGVTGLLSERTAGATSQVQNLTYQWDKVGNLKQRKDRNLNFTEDFWYDNLNRLTDSKLNNVTNLGLTYYANGNINTKSDVGTYGYPTQGASSVRPHAVTSAGSNSYAYDANGNMVTRNSSGITWYSYNLPNRIDKGSNYAQFFYGASRDRYKQIAYTAPGGDLPSGTETTIYIGGLYERVTKPSSVIEHKHYIMAGSEAVAIKTLRSNSADDVRYLHKDHLGSVDTITNESGAVVQRLSYDAFGKRRSAANWSGALSAGDWSSIAAITHRAFTFHEQLDNVDLVHMNGRVYDPNIGRFISADPFIQAPLMSQSLNRYSYVMNNPLSLIDPSGYSWLSKAFKKIGRAFGKLIKGIGQVILSAVVIVYTAAVCVGSQGSGCGPAVLQAAAWMSAIWGSGGGGRGAGNPGLGTNPNSGYGRGWNGAWIPDGAVALTPPSLPEGVVNAATGFGDAVFDFITFGVGDLRRVRNALDIDGGVDEESDAYRMSGIAGAAVGAVSGAALLARGGLLVAKGLKYARTALSEALTVDKGRHVNAARLAAKTKVFAARTAPELKQIYGWGNGLEGVQAAREALNPSSLARIQASVSRAEVEAARDLYRAAAAQGRGGQVAVERAAYMEDILKLWK